MTTRDAGVTRVKDTYTPAGADAATAPGPSAPRAVDPLMYELRQIRLVQWYHFADATLPITGSCLLLGDNGSGKSTVLDAIQLALVANLTDVRFNKAANDDSQRNAYTYVRWKNGAESKAEMRFNRPAPCTGYVMLEFARPGLAGTGERFTVGIVMDAGEQFRDLEKAHFIAPGFGVRDMPAVTEGREVRPRDKFRDAFRALAPTGAGTPKFYTDVRTFQQDLRQRLGPLPESFHRLLAKGLEFKPVGQVQDFVMNYVADPVAIHTAPLLANLEHYKSLEAQANAAVERIEALRAVCAQGAKAQEERRVLEGHRYVALRAEISAKEDAEIDAETLLNYTEAAKATTADLHLARKEHLHALQGEYQAATEALAASDAAVVERHARLELEGVRERIKAAGEAHEEAQKVLGLQRRALDALLGPDARAVRSNWTEAALFADGALYGAPEQDARVPTLRAMLTEDAYLDGYRRRGWRDRLDTARLEVEDVARAVVAREREAVAEESRLSEELTRLDAGRVRYPEPTEGLLHLLRTKLVAPKRGPVPLCELVEVTDERWRQAVEGFLAMRRFDVLVAAEDYARAASLYERNRNGVDVPKRGFVKLTGVSLPDLERIQRQRPVPERGSLAEKVHTDDPFVRAYLDFHLGHVMCCEDVAELRNHRSAVTPTVMIYQSFALRHGDPRAYRTPVLGMAARAQRREQIERELARSAEERRSVEPDLLILQRAVDAIGNAVRQVDRLPDLAERAKERTTLKWQEQQILRRLDMLDRGDIDALRAQQAAIHDEIRRAQDEMSGFAKREGELASDLRKAAQGLESARTAAKRAWDTFYDAFPADVSGQWFAYQQTWERAVDEGATPKEIFERFDQSRRSYEGRLEKAIDALKDLKAKYNATYGELGSVSGDGFDDYVRELAEWEDSRLPEYQARMAEARRQAVEQLAEDVISQLGANFTRLEREFQELNRALKGVQFGTDRYRFVYEPNPQLQGFYELVRNASSYRLDRGSLFAEEAVPASVKETLDGLVTRLVYQSASEVKTELERITDYREYFRYDIRIDSADGTRSSLDAVAGDNSGGETQTPYYIAILASMVQMYRSLRPDRRAQCGLVLFDEAFSKMDGTRIRATLAFIRGLALQVVLATPKEKIDLVAPQVGTCLLIQKDPVSGLPGVYDATREIQGALEADEWEGGGDAADVDAVGAAPPRDGAVAEGAAA